MENPNEEYIPPPNIFSKKISRRNFLKLSAVVTTGPAFDISSISSTAPFNPEATPPPHVDRFTHAPMSTEERFNHFPRLEDFLASLPKIQDSTLPETRRNEGTPAIIGSATYYGGISDRNLLEHKSRENDLVPRRLSFQRSGTWVADVIRQIEHEQRKIEDLSLREKNLYLLLKDVDPRSVDSARKKFLEILNEDSQPAHPNQEINLNQTRGFCATISPKDIGFFFYAWAMPNPESTPLPIGPLLCIDCASSNDWHRLSQRTYRNNTWNKPLAWAADLSYSALRRLPNEVIPSNEDFTWFTQAGLPGLIIIRQDHLSKLT